MSTDKFFTYDGITSQDFGVYVLDVREETFTRRDIDKIPVSGRSGDLLSDLGRYENVIVTYVCAFTENGDNGVRELNAALLSKNGYNEIYDSYYPDYYRVGFFTGGLKPKISRLDGKAVAEYSFDCKPQRFLTAGEWTALTLSSETATERIVKEGIASEIFASDFLSQHTTFNLNVPYTVISLDPITDLYSATLKLWYDDDILGTTYPIGREHGDVTTEGGWTSGSTLTHFWKNKYYEYDDMAGWSATNEYAVFPTPLRWELDYNGVKVDGLFSESDSITNPTRFEARPLIHISQSSAVHGETVALINGYPIRVKSYDEYNSIPDSGGQELDDYYIDCETMNAYKIVDYAVINCNPYVILPMEQITLKSGVNEIYVNGYIDSLEIIPRWWTL